MIVNVAHSMKCELQTYELFANIFVYKFILIGHLQREELQLLQQFYFLRRKLFKSTFNLVQNTKRLKLQMTENNHCRGTNNSRLEEEILSC